MFLAIFHLQRSLLLQHLSPGSDVTIHNVGINPTRSGIIDIVEKMGGNIQLFNQTTGAEPAAIRIQYTQCFNQ